MADERDAIVARARAVLASPVAPSAADALALARALRDGKRFALARRVLGAVARPVADAADERRVVHELALCTYKDPELPAVAALDGAFDLLAREADLAATRNQETLGLAGAICKRRFELDGRRQHLEHAAIYYRRGYQQGVERDDGYTAINLAFVLDQITRLEVAVARELGEAESAATRERREEAAAIRRDILARVGDRDAGWWTLATLAEAHAGLGEYAEAAALLRRRKDVADWQLEATARQLATLTRLHDATAVPGSPVWEMLEALLGDRAGAVTGLMMGRVGLALSGGGFRASLFHIGVLARLAELDLLRHVEVVSCVSGGSILGAHYYLEARRLLRDTPDAAITAQDYADLVKRMERDVLAGIQRNIRTRLLADPWTNLRTAFSSYSSTLRGGELYERHLYARIADGEGDRPRILPELRIQPRGEPAGFSPLRDNWRRQAKAPLLILNATTMNTGHNWQFTVAAMGEPAQSMDADVDANYRLRTVRYEEAPERYRRLRLGTAVASSACVPGLFEPVALPGLYAHASALGGAPVELLLVDGGVHDNQGVAGLLAQDCRVVLVSDASGQDASVDAPSSGRMSVTMRSNAILMARVREAQYRELAARRSAGLLHGYGFVHLKKGLATETVDAMGIAPTAPEPSRPDEPAPPERPRVPRDLQALLAATRTDLDSFSEIEAYGLMYCGYEMMARELARVFPASRDVCTGDWRFLGMRAVVTLPEGSPARAKAVEALFAARHRAFKWFRMGAAGTLTGATARVAPRRSARSIAERTLSLLLVPLGFVLGWLHLLVVDPMFLARGRLEQFAGTTSAGIDHDLAGARGEGARAEVGGDVAVAAGRAVPGDEQDERPGR